MKKGYDLYEYLKPIWRSNIITNETIMFLDEDDVAPLLYAPAEIISVKNYNLTQTYAEGKDYVVSNGKIKRTPESAIPFIAKKDYYSEEPGKYGIEVNAETIGYTGEKKLYLAYGEGDSFTRYQIAVTYSHSGKWQGAIPSCRIEKLPKTHEKAVSGGDLNITFYGDSIMTGCNSSGTPMGGNVSPYMEAYPNLITQFLSEEYGTNAVCTNVSQGGWNTKEGLDAFEERVLKQPGDLLVLGFGMNDLVTPPTDYRDMIEEMLLRFRQSNPSAEVILVATMWPHVESTWLLNQIKMLPYLRELEEKYPFVAVADMTTMHAEIMSAGKRYRDMTANNINHPNDFLARVYAQVILTAFLGDDYI
ncbi:MAG: SGNH/GDSL hydrolase family protein [Clostridia bacterium]|nr:SGNH/GDSL hydrolase family protein [Clostridia bacterium]